MAGSAGLERALIVSAGVSANQYLASHLAECGFARAVLAASGSEARRLCAGQDFAVMAVNTPLPDEFGHELALDLVQASSAGVLLLAGRESAGALAQKLGQHGVLVLAKPFSGAQFAGAVGLCAACSRRLAGLREENRRLQNQIAQVRLVSRAKCLLVAAEGITEEEAHRRIEKLAMDTRRTRGEVAQEILAGPPFAAVP